MVKLKVKLKMLNVKRCELDEVDSEETEDDYPSDIEFVSSFNNNNNNNNNNNSHNNNDYDYDYDGFLEYNNAVNYWGSGVPYIPDELKSNLTSVPLLKTSRGRVAVRPLRFVESVTGSGQKRRGNSVSDGKLAFKKQRLLEKSVEENKKGFYSVQDFLKGDIVWAKGSKRFPAWPAIVIDPIREAPDAVLKACVPGTICVMFYGYSKRGQRDYGWIKDGMIFPFLDYMESFQGQTKLYGSKPDDFHMAIEEAFIAENGYLNSGYVDKEECSTTPNVVKIPVENVSHQLLESCHRSQIEATAMPEDYRQKKVWILCNDCNGTSEVIFHIIGQKCRHCNLKCVSEHIISLQCNLWGLFMERLTQKYGSNKVSNDWKDPQICDSCEETNCLKQIRGSQIAKNVRKLPMNGLNNSINSGMVITVLTATMAIAAILLC